MASDVTRHVLLERALQASKSAMQRTMLDLANVVAAIEDVTRQTKHLAINPQIEAAPAAESGHSFDVVASEMKKLTTVAKSATDRASDLPARHLDDLRSSGAASIGGNPTSHGS